MPNKSYFNNNKRKNEEEKDEEEQRKIPDELDQKIMIASFTKIFNEKKDAIIRILPGKLANSLLNGRNDPYYHEMNLIRELYTTRIAYGIGAATLSLGFLRYAPKMASQLFHRYNKSRNINSHSMAPKSPLQQQEKSNGTFIGRTLGMFFDLSISLLFGMSFGLYATQEDGKQNVTIMTKIPLLPGRSVVSDELCTDLMTQYYKFPITYWSHVQNQNNYDINQKGSKSIQTLKSIQELVHNCERRNAYETLLKDDLILGNHSDNDHEVDGSFSNLSMHSTKDTHEKHISIPYPGVPTD